MTAKACWPCQLVLAAALATLAQINAADPSSSGLPEVESLSLHKQNGLQRIHNKLIQAAHAADTVVASDADAVVPEESDDQAAESQPSELAQASARDNDDTNDSTDGGHGYCFPQQAQVESESRGRVPIGSVEVGERLMTIGGYSEVLFFAVRQLGVVSRCVTITTNNVTLALTGSHAVFTADGAPIQAKHLAVGDTVLTAGDIVRLEMSDCIGLVAPITSSGSLVVDLVATSDYGSLGTKLGQRAAHVVLLPLRALRWFFPSWDFWRANGKDGRHPVMVWGQDFLGL